jgi:hypothetical protein
MPHASNPAMRPILMVLALLSSMFLSCGGASDAQLIEEAKKVGEKIGKRAGRQAAKKARKAKKGKKARTGQKGKNARNKQTRLKLDRPGEALRFAQASTTRYIFARSEVDPYIPEFGSTLGDFARKSVDLGHLRGEGTYGTTTWSTSVRSNCKLEEKRRVQWDCRVSHRVISRTIPPSWDTEALQPTSKQQDRTLYFTVRDSDGQTTMGKL